LERVPGIRLLHGSCLAAARFVPDSPLEGNGFELPVPNAINSGFEGSAELGSIDRRLGGIIRAVVGRGKPIELLRHLEEPSFFAE
jgi:hypothetical protein